MTVLPAPTTARSRAAWVRAEMDRVDEWRASVLSLLAGEGLMSRTARSVLSSDTASRLSEGLPGARELSLPASVNRWPDELEGILESVVQELFGTAHVEWRPTSNSMANAVALRALTRPGDVIAVQPSEGGGNVSYQSEAVAGLLGLRVVPLPACGDYELDSAVAGELIARVRPRAVILGGSKVLFPYPVEAMRAAADEVGAYVIFDAAHVGPFVAAGTFPHPLAAGAHVLTTGTHKLMGGPVGGLVLTDDAELASRIRDAVHPQFVQTRDLNKYAAAAISLLELLDHAVPYAMAMLENVATLGDALGARGFGVRAARRGYSRTHMIFAAAAEPAAEIAAGCDRNGILISHTSPPGADAPRVLRISVAQVTRLGMGPDEMVELADLIAEAGVVGHDVRDEVVRLSRRFPHVGFSFDD